MAGHELRMIELKTVSEICAQPAKHPQYSEDVVYE
jgi:hypothetical protein